MAVRDFDGSNDFIVLDNGAIGAFNDTGDSHTVVAIVKPALTANPQAAFSIKAGASSDNMTSLYFSDTGYLHLGTDDPSGVSYDGPGFVDTSWQIVAVSKGAGTVAAKLHRKVLGSGSWSHVTGTGTIGTTTSVASECRIGEFSNAAGDYDGLIAVIAFYATELSDGQIETIQTTPSTQTLLDLGAVGLWELIQPSTSIPVTDLTGGGADQTAITGTTVVEGDDPPGWVFSRPTRTGTASQVDGSGGNGSTSVTVPSDATGAVLFWCHWDSTPGGLGSFTLGGNSFTRVTERWSVGGAANTGIAYLDTLPGTGSQTFAWTWTLGVTPDEGGEMAIVWIKDQAGDPRDSAVHHAEGTSSPNVTIATEATDLVLGFGQSFTGTNPTTTGTAFISNVTVNSEVYDVTEVTAGASTTTVTVSGEYPSVAAISFPATDLIGMFPIGDDGAGYWEVTPGAWPPTGGAWTDVSGSTTMSVYKADEAGLGPATSENVYLRFDTSGLPDAATVTEARLQLYVVGKTDANNLSLVGDYYDYGGSPSVAGDYIETASPSIFSAVDLGAITTGVVNTFALTDLTGINETGYTGIRLTLSAITPGFNHDMVQFASIDAALEEPRLLVTYTLEEEGEFPLMWFTAIV